MKLQGKAVLGLTGAFAGFLIACSETSFQTQVQAPHAPPPTDMLSMDISSSPAHVSDISPASATDPAAWPRHAILIIRWPQRTVQTIPLETKSILFEAFVRIGEGGLASDTLIASASISRPADAATSSVIIPQEKDTYLPTTTSYRDGLVFRAQAKDSAGRIVAEAETRAHVRENKVIIIALNLVPKPTPTPAPTPTPTPTPKPTPTPTPTLSPLFVQVDGVPGLEKLSDAPTLYPGDTKDIYIGTGLPARIFFNVVRSQDGTILYHIAAISARAMYRVLQCAPYGSNSCGNICDYMGTSPYYSSHDALFKLASSGNVLEFVDTRILRYKTDNQFEQCAIYSADMSKYPRSMLLESVDKQKGAMTIKAGVIPSGETSIPIPEYFSDTKFENSRMTDTAAALWYVSWGLDDPGSIFAYEPMKRLAIARWQFDTNQWVRTPATNKALQYFNNSNGDMYKNCNEYGWCQAVYRIASVVYSASEGKFYFVFWGSDGGKRLYRVSEDTLKTP